MKRMRTVLDEILGEDLSSGEVLSGARIDKGLSQNELEEITGIARSNISALENGRIEMTDRYAIIFGVVLGIHPAKILFPNGFFKKTEEVMKIEKKAIAVFKRRSTMGK